MYSLRRVRDNFVLSDYSPACATVSPSSSRASYPAECSDCHSPQRASTMWRWTVSNGVSACWWVCILSALSVVLVSAPTVTCISACNALRDTNFSISAPAASVRHVRSYNHLQGDVRRRKLYSYQKFFLRIDKTGKVNGTKSKDDPYSVMEITSVDVGVVAIRGLNSNCYLAISKKGQVYGERHYGVNCRLKERIEENGYNTYASAQWRNRRRHMFVGLSASGRALRARKTHRKDTATHFLPILV
ncbi:fibroblast growth factor 10b [Brachyhypopomus gauderio]|uniref:fibroblast growth factor 10b n=1 Tax=Brachyhypopomus gauderio TaxID=698409 RepID=UPI0040435E4D